MINAIHFKWWSTIARHPQVGHSINELDQLGRRSFETCCKISRITPGTRFARFLTEFVTEYVITESFWGLKPPNYYVTLVLTKITYCRDGHLIWLAGHFEMAAFSG